MISLGLSLGVNFTLVFEIADGLCEGITGLLKDNVDLGLLGDGSLDLVGRSIGVEDLSVVLDLQVVNFSSGRSNPCGELPSSGDFVLFKVLDGILHSGLEVFKDGVDLFGKGSLSLGSSLGFFIIRVG